ncbi:hypothetical protein DBR32_07985 [Taibaiella sp. KBW10]|uniref:glycosyltransferase n=1 Tax=Taibaiella sp. KBW10 TaxID=2153357 RepID=UPI000F5A5692|nr:glycosyltransferase [Taibaiella sp. KBW10]RQO30662.1 hypothetical protein DBR32_07985 [Taibaiella sp. KBW10]
MFYAFLCVVLLQYLFGFIYQYKPEKPLICPEDADLPKVSVLICGKNEAANFKKHLPKILGQHYPATAFEVLVVDDGSTDATQQVLQELQQQYPQLRIHSLKEAEEKKFPGKKNALYKGLQHCTYPIVLLTDADCVPASSDWIRIMAGHYQQAKNKNPEQAYFVLAYGAYQQVPGLLNKFIRWETVHTFQQYSSWAKLGLPYMGVGRNLLYEREAVLRTLDNDEDFAQKFKQTPSGDDDLIVAYLAHKENTLVVSQPEAKTVSEVHTSWAAWWKQKTRHVSSGKYYPEKIKTALGLYALSAFLYWITGLYLLIAAFTLQIKIIVLLLMLGRILLYGYNARKWYRALDEKNIISFYLTGDILWMIYNMVLSPFIFWKNKQQWK